MPVKDDNLSTLIDQTQRNPDSRESVMRLLQGIGQAFVAAKDDPARIQEVSDQLHSNASAIVDAIVAKLPGATDSSGPEATQTQRVLQTEQHVPTAGPSSKQKQEPEPVKKR